jgi:hypothetical protein
MIQIAADLRTRWVELRVELRRFEPRTSCMPYTHDPSRVIAHGRPEWI